MLLHMPGLMMGVSWVAFKEASCERVFLLRDPNIIDSLSAIEQAGTWDCSNQWISSVIKLGAPNGYCGRAVYRSDDIHKTGPSEYLGTY